MTNLDVVTIGESMVQLTPPETGLLRHAAQFDRFVAGAASNVAVGLVQMGHRAGWISRVGDDEFGACVRASIRGTGVDTTHVVEDEAAPTGIYVKERRRPPQTRVHYYRDGSAASRLAPDDLEPDYIGRADYLHLTGILPALSSTCRETTWAALRIAAERGVAVSLDPNVRSKLWAEDEARTVLQEMIPRVEVLLLGRDEATLLSGEDRPEAAARALTETGPSEVVVRRGDGGASALDEEGDLVHADAIDVEPVEVVGAGDAFNAGYLAGRLRGWPIRRCLRLGNVLGGLA
ncbi:MAG: sugar kinase, partial [Salinibacter sp.]